MPSNRAPRGSASCRARRAALAGAGDVRGLIAAPRRPAAPPRPARCARARGRGRIPPRAAAAEAAHQLVVAPAAAEDVAERRVVDLHDRARVVAEVAQQPEVEVDPVGHSRALRAAEVAASRWRRARPLRRPARARDRGPRGRRAGSAGRAAFARASSGSSSSSTSSSRPTRSWVARRSRMRSRASPSTPSSSRSWR